MEVVDTDIEISMIADVIDEDADIDDIFDAVVVDATIVDLDVNVMVFNLSVDLVVLVLLVDVVVVIKVADPAWGVESSIFVVDDTVAFVLLVVFPSKKVKLIIFLSKSNGTRFFKLFSLHENFHNQNLPSFIKIATTRYPDFMNSFHGPSFRCKRTGTVSQAFTFLDQTLFNISLQPKLSFPSRYISLLNVQPSLLRAFIISSLSKLSVKAIKISAFLFGTIDAFTRVLS